MVRESLLIVVVAGAVALLAPSPAAAQIGMGTDIIVGVVTGEDGAPVQDATVEAFSLETQVTRRARTDSRGRYTILFPDGGGQYRMTARVLGMTPRTVLLVRDADEDRLVWNIQLRAGAVTVEAITVRAAPQVRAGEGPSPGATERAFTADALARIPLDATDLATLAGLSPGVLTIAGTDTTATAFSVAGLGPDANALTLDGLLFGTSSVPQEGLRQTRVITSTYDVSRGQFSGGLIASTTRSGSNVLQGSSQVQAREEEFALGEGDTPYSQGFTQRTGSAGLGGPIVRDRVFVFGSFQARLRSDPQQTLLSAGAADYARLGVHPDSVARFLGILTALGVPPTSVANAATRADDNLSGMVRADWVVSASHTLTLRGDWRGTSQDPTRLGSLALPQTGGTMESSGGGVMATLTSRFGATVLNEFRGYWQRSRRDGDAYTLIPQGRVQVASDLTDSVRSVVTLAFGGNSGLPSRSRSSGVEVSNELSWLPGSGRHRFKLGVSFQSERARDLSGANQLGTFVFNSLTDLEAGVAASFTRTLRMTERDSRSRRWGLFAGDVWMASRPFQLSYGVRVDGSAFSDPPEYNPAVDAVFGRRTDYLPREWHASPRVGFTWTVGGGAPMAPGGGPGMPGGGPMGRGQGGGGPGQARAFGSARFVIRGGIGEFRSQPPTGVALQARAATGLATSAADVVCSGAAIPTLDWAGYWLDPGGIPEACLDGGSTGAGAAPAPRQVMVLAPGFEAPRAWRASLGVERRLTQIFRLTVEGSLSRGVAQTGYRDLNLDATESFSLASEGGRPVFVAPSDITPTTGTPRFAASRRDTTFGRVLEASSGFRSRSEQLTVGLSGVVGRGIVLSLSYTTQRARDLATGARGSTAGDPNVAEWARSDFERRHGILGTLTYPLSQSLEITSIGRLTSGSPFTPTVGGDVNGDGSRNDRAFVFAPGTATAEAEGMARLLASASDGVRSCLERQVGSVAGRNTCTGPWQASLELQMNWRPAFWGLNRRLQVSVVTYNLLRGVDELLHGQDGAKGWGLQTRPDGTLLYVTGFDPAARRYAYEVNERFGSTAGSATAYRPPFQIGIQARLTIGPDRMRQALDAMRRGGGIAGAAAALAGPGVAAGGFRGPAASPAEMIARLEAALPNPPGAVLEMRDSLRLDSGQVVLLTPLRDSLAARNAVRLDSLRGAVRQAGNNTERLMQLIPQLQPLFQAARTDVAQILVSVRAILTEEQWVLVPESVKIVQLGPRRGMMGPGQMRPPPP